MDDVTGLVGLPKEALDTPALLVELDALEANIAHMAAACRDAGVSWRPHIKGNKTPEIVAKELAAGAIGVTCAKVGEAEVMVAAGVRDILIANQVVGAAKIRRVLALLDRADAKVAVDSDVNVQELSREAASAGLVLGVVIEVDTGMHRAGVAPGDAVVALARRIAGLPGLRFAGVMGWEAHAVAIADPAEKQRAVAAAIGELVASAQACAAAGLPAGIVSCGGTGTFPLCTRQPGVTEVQAGGGILGDVLYRRRFNFDGQQSLTLLATVTSRPTPTRIIVDAGKKAMSSDGAVPEPIGLEGVERVGLSAEHGSILLDAPSEAPRIGDKVEFVVGYSDTTVHLHERIHAIRNGRVAAVWQVTARGKLA
jgi:D-serine deaminase-like pyridoxal phosphate-dependent protein